MDEFVKILNERGLKESTIKTYKTNLKKLLADLGVNYDGANFIKKNKAKVLALLETKSKSVRKNYLSVMLVILSPIRKNPPPPNKAIYEEFNKLLLGLNEKYNEQLATKELSVKEQDNFITWADIVKKRDELVEKLLSIPTDISLLTKAEKLLIQDAVILGIYTYNPPRRLIYAKSKMITEEQMNAMTEDELNNLVALVFKDGEPVYFHFGKLATKSKAKRNIHVPIEQETFKDLLKLWREVNTTDNLLYNQSFNKISENYLTQQLKRIFSKVYKKNISVVMLRKIFLSTNQFPTGTLELIAEQMNHSVSTQQAVYTKKVPVEEELAGVEETKNGEPAPEEKKEEPPKRKIVKIKVKRKKPEEKKEEPPKKKKRKIKVKAKKLNLKKSFITHPTAGRVTFEEYNRIEEERKRIEKEREETERQQMGIEDKISKVVRRRNRTEEDREENRGRKEEMKEKKVKAKSVAKDKKAFASNVKLWELKPHKGGWLFIDRNTMKVYSTNIREEASMFFEFGEYKDGEIVPLKEAGSVPFKVGKKRKMLISRKWRGIDAKKISL